LRNNKLTISSKCVKYNTGSTNLTSSTWPCSWKKNHGGMNWSAHSTASNQSIVKVQQIETVSSTRHAITNQDSKKKQICCKSKRHCDNDGMISNIEWTLAANKRHISYNITIENINKTSTLIPVIIIVWASCSFEKRNCQSPFS